MLDVGIANVVGDDSHLTTFVDRLAGARADGPTGAARTQIQARIAAGAVPAGLRLLAEALAASAGDGPAPPQPRHPVEDPGSVAGAVRGANLVVLDEFGVDAVANAIGALLADGRRIVVTAADRAELTALIELLPAEVAACCVDNLPALSAGEQRELRRLLATSTQSRRARRDQQLPPADRLPSAADVADLSARARSGGGRPSGPELVPSLLADMAPDRRAAVIGVAQRVVAALAGLGPRGERSWSWALLSDLVYNRHRATFDGLAEDAAQAAAVTERSGGASPVTVVGPLPANSGEVLRRYMEFLRTGGRSRSLFRAPAQREVDPVLRQVRVGGVVPETPEQVRLTLEHVELAERLVRIDAGCREVGVPAPRNAAELSELAAGLTRVGAAAHAVGALRHDVAFIHPNAPVAVPDLATAEQIAAAIIDYAAHGSAEEAGQRLDRLAAQLSGLIAAQAMTPEHEQAVTALRERDAARYAEAVDALLAARRDVRDEGRCAELLDRLRATAPRIAQAWEAASREGTGGFGLAWFVEADRVLEKLPPADAADVVVLLGAADLGVDRLLLTAVAPRLVAVVGPGARNSGGPTLLGVLQRAAALTISGRAEVDSSAGRVVQMPSSSSRARTAAAAARQNPA